MSTLLDEIAAHVNGLALGLMEEEGYAMDEKTQEQLDGIAETLLDELEDRLTELFNEVEWRKA